MMYLLAVTQERLVYKLNFLHLSAAFDTIDHRILQQLQRLEITCVSATAVEWFKSYISNRHHEVVVRGRKSADHLLLKLWCSSGFCNQT